VRWGDFDPRAPRATTTTETGVALNYFFNKHNHKLQFDFRESREQGDQSEGQGSAPAVSVDFLFPPGRSPGVATQARPAISSGVH
jgi:hypothetical protein